MQSHMLGTLCSDKRINGTSLQLPVHTQYFKIHNEQIQLYAWLLPLLKRLQQLQLLQCCYYYNYYNNDTTTTVTATIKQTSV